MTSPERSSATDEHEVRRLYQGLLAAWNRRDAEWFAAAYGDHATFVPFDGSHKQGRDEIDRAVRAIFAAGPTGRYVSDVRDVRFLRSDVALLRSVVGRIPPGESDLDPALNAIQSLVAVKQDGRWVIELFQNTPAAFQDRPDLRQHLTEEMREIFSRRGLTSA